MLDPNAPKVINEYLKEDYESHDEEGIMEPRQSIIEALRQKGKALNSREEAEAAFALSITEECETPTPEEILIAKQAYIRNNNIQLN